MRYSKLPIAVILLVLMNLGIVTAQDNAPITSGGASPITSDNASQIKALISLSNDVKDVSVSPDSSMIAVASQYEDYPFNISVYALDTGNEISEMHGGMDFFVNLVWSPDSKKFAVISHRTNASGEERVVVTYTVAIGVDFRHYIEGFGDTFYGDFVYYANNPPTPVQVAWDPTSHLIAVALNESLDIYDIEANTKLISKPSSGVQSIQWTSDSKFIITRSKLEQSNQFQVTLWGIPSVSS